jgi:hypothetical protein
MICSLFSSGSVGAGETWVKGTSAGVESRVREGSGEIGMQAVGTPVDQNLGRREADESKIPDQV